MQTYYFYTYNNRTLVDRVYIFSCVWAREPRAVRVLGFVEAASESDAVSVAAANGVNLSRSRKW